MNIRILTLSDKGARGERTDASGPALAAWLTDKGYPVAATEIMPDELELIADRLSSWADRDQTDLILTTGGTGVSPRDLTPDATLRVVERTLPGFGEAMRLRSLQKTPNAIISRALAGIRGNCLIINLPGSPKGAVECLEAVWDAVPHTIAKLQGDQSDCAAPPHKSTRTAPPAVSFVAKSGTGKTTLLEQVITELKSQGWRIGVIKHDAHRFDIDHPGKDSHRLTAAGADTMLISSPEKLAVVKKHAASPPLEELIATYFGDVDLLLTEGFKKSGQPKIELHRAERSQTLICRGEEHDPTLIAVASDEPLTLDVPLLDLNKPKQVAAFLVEYFLAGRSAEKGTT
jgi:molybdopterin-guanine dinucleotide biosynthesis protein B/molybdopterin-guanine dinucleotide biosynthesis protein